jgi:hypothetical protein
MRNANLLSLALSSLPARCCDVSFLSTYLFPFCFTAVFVISFAIIGTCLDFAAEDRRVTERNAALDDMGWPDLLSKLAVMMMMVIDNLVSPMISPR